MRARDAHRACLRVQPRRERPEGVDAASDPMLCLEVQLNPSGSMLRLYYAMHLCGIGEFEEAMIHREIACQLDPSAMAIRGNATWVLYLARRMQQAVDECRAIREIDPASAYAAFSHGLVRQIIARRLYYFAVQNLLSQSAAEATEHCQRNCVS